MRNLLYTLIVYFFVLICCANCSHSELRTSGRPRNARFCDAGGIDAGNYAQFNMR